MHTHTLSHHHTHTLLLGLVFLLFSLSTHLLTIVSGTVNFDLIHRHSPLSPFYDPSKSQSQLLQIAAFRPFFRRVIRRLKPNPKPSPKPSPKSSPRRSHHSHSHSLSLHTDVTPSLEDLYGDYIIRIYIGTPPLETWSLVDTGSDLVWLQCLPCDTCYPQNLPLFNPKNSSSYRKLTCHSQPCTDYFTPNSTSCGSSDQCLYHNYAYNANGSSTSGELATDFIHFEGFIGNFIRLKTLFGCGHNNSGFGKTDAGIVGLGTGPLSLISQIGSIIGYKFSYCLVPFFSNSTGQLKLGEKAAISQPNNQLASTPYINITGFPFYWLTIQGIIVGEKIASVNANQSESGLILIDSGTSGTTIPPGFYNRVEALVKEEIGVKAVQNPPQNFNLCFKNESVAYNKIINLNFVVIFEGSAKVSLKTQNIFVAQDENLLCFAIFPANQNFYPIYGNLVQVDFEVEYDIKRKMVSFAPMDCSKN